MTTDIVVNSLTAVAGLGSISLGALWAAPAGKTCLPYLQAAKVEFWAASTNNFANASKIGESESVGLFVHGGLADGITRYYWARTVDSAGQFGAFYPSGSGVAATTKTSTPPANSVGSAELKNNAVGNQHIIANSVTTDKLSVSQLSAITANIGTVTAGNITGVVITGGTVRTSSGVQRVEMTSANTLKFYNASGVAVITANTTTSGAGAMSIIGSGGRGLTVDGGNNTQNGENAALVVANAQGGPGINSLVLGGGINNHGARMYNDAAGGGDAAIATSSSVGGYGVYVQSGGYFDQSGRGYLPFTGAHQAFILKAETEGLCVGDIVCDTKVVARNGVSDTISEVTVCREIGQKSAIGVLADFGAFNPTTAIAALPDVHKRTRRKADAKLAPIPPLSKPVSTFRKILAQRYDLATINGLGEGQVNVCGRGGDLSIGDYICASDMPGKGQRQNTKVGLADDLYRRCTVAQAREAVVFDHKDQVKMVACIYRCG